MNKFFSRFFAFVLTSIFLMSSSFALTGNAAVPFHTAELIFPLEHRHNHSSAIVETPKGSLFVCWFNGSGERQADDVKVEGARLKKGSNKWSERFTLADTPGYPDTNATIFIDPKQRLWLMYPTILANEWYTALMKYKISSDYERDGPPRWESNDVLHVTPGPEFAPAVNKALDVFASQIDTLPEGQRERARTYISEGRKKASDKYFSRLGWMTRAHPFVLNNERLIVPLYSDGYSFSLMVFTDDWGKSWKTSTPLVGRGNIQPSIVQARDGSLFTLMRDNGPAPKRLQMSRSRDRGETWDPVSDSNIPNPGSGAEIISLKNGHFALIYNDTEAGRHSLAVSISDDEGATWKWTRHLELEPPGTGEFHYPSIIQARDGSLHASYSYFINDAPLTNDTQGKTVRSKAIKHAHFNEEWVMQGDAAR
jgi:predicted neuraminidase